jgi:phospholipid/cholesterol/gamma-HCH transport system permease protein
MNKVQTTQLEGHFQSYNPSKTMKFAAAIGYRTIGLWLPFVQFLSDAAAVIWQGCRPTTWRRPVRTAFMRICYQAGTRAVPFVLVSGVFIGFGLVAQSLYWLETFGGKALFGSFLSLVLVREVAPVLVGLIMIGRSGSVIMADLGIMKAGGQVHMLEAQGIDPFLFLVVPRVLALSVCTFCLSIVFVTIALLAGFVSGTLFGLLNFSFFDFFGRALRGFGPEEYVLITLKTVIIGFVVGLISCKTALATAGPSVNVLEILPRGFAKSVLSTLLISVTLTLML